MLGYLIGLIIAAVLFILLAGALNSLITSLLWFRVKTSLLSVFAHGILLLIALLLANGAISIVPSIFFPGVATTLLTSIIAAFVDGFIGKKIAGWWKEEYEEAIPESVQAEIEDKNL